MLTPVKLDPNGTPEALDDGPLDYSPGPKDLTKFRSLEAAPDARESSLSILEDLMSNLERLRLKHSILPSIRDICCRRSCLSFLSIARNGINSLNGISTFSPRSERPPLKPHRVTQTRILQRICFATMESVSLSSLETNCGL
jgi:hypothetical protein